MSLDATRWAWEQKVKGSHKLVLLSLADRADERHGCYPSVDRLTDDTCLNRKTVMEAISELEGMGIIAVDRLHGAGNRYRLIGVSDRHKTSTRNGTSTESGTGPESGTRPVPKTGPQPVPKTGHESTNESTTNRKAPAKAASKAKRRTNDGTTFLEYVAACKASGQQVISDDSHVFVKARAQKIPDDFLWLAWKVFADLYSTSRKSKRYTDWVQVFYNAATKDWLKVWAVGRDGEYYLTTIGKQAAIEHGVDL